MSRTDLACYLCERDLGDIKVSLDDLMRRTPFVEGKLFVIEKAEVGPGLVNFRRRNSLGELPEEVGSTFWNESDPPALPAFGDRIGQTVIVCQECCEKHAALFNEKLEGRYDRNLARKYEKLCRDLFDHGLLSFVEPQKLQNFLDTHGDSTLGDNWTAILFEIFAIAEMNEVVEKVRDRLEPLVQATLNSKCKNGMRLCQAIAKRPLPTA